MIIRLHLEIPDAKKATLFADDTAAAALIVAALRQVNVAAESVRILGRYPEAARDPSNRLCCPRCGNDDASKLSYDEDGLLSREVQENNPGYLELAGDYSTYDESPELTWLCCTAVVDGRTCGQTFLIPDEVETDFR